MLVPDRSPVKMIEQNPTKQSLETLKTLLQKNSLELIASVFKNLLFVTAITAMTWLTQPVLDRSFFSPSNSQTSQAIGIFALLLIAGVTLAIFVQIQKQVHRHTIKIVSDFQKNLIHQVLHQKLQFMNLKDQAKLNWLFKEIRQFSHSLAFLFRVFSFDGPLFIALTFLFLRQQIEVLALIAAWLIVWSGSTVYRILRSPNEADRGDTPHPSPFVGSAKKIQRTLSQIEAIKELCIEDLTEQQLFMTMTNESNQFERQRFNSALFQSFEYLLSPLALLSIFSLAFYASIQNHLTVSQLYSYSFALLILLLRSRSLFVTVPDAVKNFSSGLRHYHFSKQNLEEHQESEGEQAQASLPFPDARNLIFHNVTSEGDGRIQLQNFAATFAPHQMIEVIDPTHQGRELLRQLLTRLQDPIKGHISIGRTAINKNTLHRLRQMITATDHHPYFVEGQIIDNLLLGNLKLTRENFSEERVAHCLEVVGLYEKIHDLPEKLETTLSESGFPLSENDQQKLQIARALLRADTQILLLDEPSRIFSDDHEMQKFINGIEEKLKQGLIVFWIESSPTTVSLPPDYRLLFTSDGETILQEALKSPSPRSRQKPTLGITPDSNTESAIDLSMPLIERVSGGASPPSPLP